MSRAKNILLYGVGINDSDTPVQHNEKVITESGKSVVKVLWRCPYYTTWTSMLRRCYSKAPLANNSAYADVTVCEEWHRFSVFRSWMETQDWEGKQLDKDILGSKVYCEDSCVFVSQTLNCFLTDRRSDRGEYLIGVSLHSRGKKYQANCRNPFTGIKDYLGLFDSELEAYNAWRQRKHEHACKLAEAELDFRIKKALTTKFL